MVDSSLWDQSSLAKVLRVVQGGQACPTQGSKANFAALELIENILETE